MTMSGPEFQELLRAAIPVVAIVCTFIMLMVLMITSALVKASREKQREESRREIAAHVATGAISAEDGAKLIASGKKIKDRAY